MRHYRHAIISCVIMLLVFTTGAAAQEEADVGVYVQGGASLYLMKFPDYKPIQAFNYPGGLGPYSHVKRLAVHDDPVVGFMGSLTLGVRAACPLFFEMTARIFEDQDRDNRDYDAYELGSGYIGFAPFGDDLSFQATKETAYVHLKSEFAEYGFRMLLGYALDLGHGLTLSPFVGGEVMYIGQTYDMSWVTTNDPDIIVFHEKLDARYGGALAGARLQARLGEYLATFSGSVARYEVDTDYYGSVYDATAFFRDCSITDVDDSAWALEADAGLSRTWGPWSLGVEVGYRQLSYVPQVVANDRDNTVHTTGDFTHLKGYESRAYSLDLGVSYAF